MKFIVTFKGHIDERKRPEFFPHEIRDVVILEAEDKTGLVKAFNDYTISWIRIQGMTVRKDPYAVEDPAKVDINRMFVPMHMITYIDSEIKAINDQEGILLGTIGAKQ